MSTTNLRRVFVYNKQELEDPNPSANLSPEDVVAFYSRIYPELATASIEQTEIKDGVIRYEMRRAVGTKG